MHLNKRNQNKNKTKSHHTQINHAFYYSIYPTNSVMVSLKDGFTSWLKSEKEDFLWRIFYIDLSMMSSPGANPIFLNKKYRWTSRTVANPSLPTSSKISFLSYPPPPLKVKVIPANISTSDQRCFKFMDQRWNNVEPTLKMKQNATSDF